jgi:hypothetical protein
VALSDDDLDRLGRSIELAREASMPPADPAAPGVVVDGPANGYADVMKSLYEAKFLP